jgi:hypothetical protein
MIEIKIIAPIVLDEVLRNVRKESAKLQSERITRPGQVNEVEPANMLSIVSISLENRFIIRPSGYVWQSAGGEFSRFDGAYCCLKEGHWAVHDAANSILPGR